MTYEKFQRCEETLKKIKEDHQDFSATFVLKNGHSYSPRYYAVTNCFTDKAIVELTYIDHGRHVIVDRTILFGIEELAAIEIEYNRRDKHDD